MLQERARGRFDASLLPADQDDGRGRDAPGEQQAWSPSKLLPGLQARRGCTATAFSSSGLEFHNCFLPTASRTCWKRTWL